MKNILGAGIILADIIAGMATPKIMAGLKGPHPHMTGPVALYVVLGLATLWVIVSVAGTVRGATRKPAPPQRAAFTGIRERRY